MKTTNTTMISVKIDKNLKEQAAKIADEFGFSLSSLIKASLKKIVRERKIEYSLEEELDYNPELVKNVLEAEEEALKGINLSPPLKNSKEIEDYLMSL